MAVKALLVQYSWPSCFGQPIEKLDGVDEMNLRHLVDEACKNGGCVMGDAVWTLAAIALAMVIATIVTFEVSQGVGCECGRGDQRRCSERKPGARQIPTLRSEKNLSSRART